MPLHSRQPLLQVEHLGKVTLVKFRSREILDVITVEEIGDQLFRLVQEEHGSRLLLNLGNIDRLSTAMIGKFMAAQQKVRAAAGQVALCSLHPGLHEILDMFKLTDKFAIYPDEQSGLEELGR